MSKSENSGCGISIPILIGSIGTTLIGQTMHGSFWWGFVDFFLWPLVWIKWILFREITLSIIKESFNWFIQ